MRSPIDRLDLRELACDFPLIVYLYPGCAWSPEHHESTVWVDAAQHRAFRDHQPDLEARGYRAIGISSQPLSAQTLATIENRISHQLFSDPQLALARQLCLPTFAFQGLSWYRRLTLVVEAGRIIKVFFPVASPWRNPAQVIAWMILQGIS